MSINKLMNTTIAKQILVQKEPANLYDVVQPALETVEIRDLLVEGGFAKDETYRYNCVRVLFRAIRQCPELFYPYWDRFEKMVDSPNGFYRSSSAQAIAHLSTVDTNKSLDPIFDHYLALFDDGKIMVTHYFIETIGVIALARHDLQNKIINTLLGIDKTHHSTGHKDLLKADIIGVFDQLFDTLTPSQQKRVLAFVEKGLNSNSAKTRKAAKKFQKRLI